MSGRDGYDRLAEDQHIFGHQSPHAVSAPGDPTSAAMISQFSGHSAARSVHLEAPAWAPFAGDTSSLAVARFAATDERYQNIAEMVQQLQATASATVSALTQKQVELIAQQQAQHHQLAELLQRSSRTQQPSRNDGVEAPGAQFPTVDVGTVALMGEGSAFTVDGRAEDDLPAIIFNEHVLPLPVLNQQQKEAVLLEPSGVAMPHIEPVTEAPSAHSAPMPIESKTYPPLQSFEITPFHVSELTSQWPLPFYCPSTGQPALLDPRQTYAPPHGAPPLEPHLQVRLWGPGASAEDMMIQQTTCAGPSNDMLSGSSWLPGCDFNTFSSQQRSWDDAAAVMSTLQMRLPGPPSQSLITVPPTPQTQSSTVMAHAGDHIIAHQAGSGGLNDIQQAVSAMSDSAPGSWLNEEAAAAVAVELVATYPPAQATQEAVLADREIFVACLSALHKALGTRFRIPVVGGQDLDLWMLYRQVVAHGGLAATVTMKRWAQVCAPFKFPATFTSRGYTMRRLYSQILWHFEQVYMHGAQGPLRVPPSPDGMANVQLMDPAACTGEHGLARLLPAVPGARSLAPRARAAEQGGVAPELVPRVVSPSSTTPSPLSCAQQQWALDAAPPLAPAGPPPFTAMYCGPVAHMPSSSESASPYDALQDIQVGAQAQGVITRRIDCGFWVQLQVGGATFQGALFHPPPLLPLPSSHISPHAETDADNAGGSGNVPARQAEGSGAFFHQTSAEAFSPFDRHPC